MKKDFIMGTYQKKLCRAMNNYAEATDMKERFTPGYVRDNYSENMAKEIIENHYLPLMLSDYMHEKEMKERKKKSVKTKLKRKVTKA